VWCALGKQSWSGPLSLLIPSSPLSPLCPDHTLHTFFIPIFVRTVPSDHSIKITPSLCPPTPPLSAHLARHYRFELKDQPVLVGYGTHGFILRRSICTSLLSGKYVCGIATCLKRTSQVFFFLCLFGGCAAQTQCKNPSLVVVVAFALKYSTMWSHHVGAEHPKLVSTER